MRHCIGIDVGGTTIKFGLFQEDGTLLAKWDIPTKTEGRTEKMYQDMADSVRAELAKHDMKVSDMIGVGVGIPGPVMPDGSISALVNLGVYDLNLDKELPAYLDGVTVKAVNDAIAEFSVKTTFISSFALSLVRLMFISVPLSQIVISPSTISPDVVLNFAVNPALNISFT